MAQIVYTRQAFADLDRLAEFLEQDDPPSTRHVLPLIFTAVEMLERHPLIGRPAEHGFRELVISRGRTGYLALYCYERAADVVLVLAIRHQREAGYLDLD